MRECRLTVRGTSSESGLGALLLKGQAVVPRILALLLLQPLPLLPLTRPLGSVTGLEAALRGLLPRAARQAVAAATSTALARRTSRRAPEAHV